MIKKRLKYNNVHRKLLNLFLPRKIHIIYRHEYFMHTFANGTVQPFDPMKFKKIKDELIRKNLIRHQEVWKPQKISEQNILLVHQKEYVEKFKNPLEIGHVLGLNYVNMWDTYIFEYFKFVTGGTYLGLQLALNTGLPVFNLGGGFHHAHPAKAEGFCILNDTAIAIEAFRKKCKKPIRFLIVDLDYHQGNGNAEYFEQDDLVFTFSMHHESWQTFNSSTNLDVELAENINDSQYMEELQKTLPPILSSFKPDILIYLAGTDVAATDSLSGFALTPNGVLQRDTYVYKLASSSHIPILTLSAGGYGPNSWEYTFRFIEWVIHQKRQPKKRQSIC